MEEGIKGWCKMKNMKIKLIKLQPKHFPLFFKWWNNKELRRLTSGVFKKITRKEINEILNQHLLNKKGFDFIITANKKLIGHILVQKKKGKKNWEVYIALGEKKYWDKGIGTAALKQACRWFFNKFSKEKCLDLGVLTNNYRAIRSYEKVGFKKVRIIHSRKHFDTVLMRKGRTMR